ncbi:MAG: hypothetical protein O3A46_05330, partial [Candidatus Poribacteria bacterium]|nr:hypothetical protein [Candidatus Poribacteria bacterium]
FCFLVASIGGRVAAVALLGIGTLMALIAFGWSPMMEAIITTVEALMLFGLVFGFPREHEGPRFI